MMIINEIASIVIERPTFSVKEIRGRDSAGKEFLLQANEKLRQEFYIRDKKTGNNIILQQIKIGLKENWVFFVESPDKPNENLLIKIEQELTGEPN